MNLLIAKYPADDAILRVQTTDMPVSALATTEIQDLIDNMIDTMYSADGIGIAAPQVHKDLRVCIIGKEAHDSLTEDMVLVNPTWERTSRHKGGDMEGCLSIPRTHGKVIRWKNIKVTALDRHGEPLVFEAHKFFARVIQHEVDHLDGVLFIDKATDIHEAEVHP